MADVITNKFAYNVMNDFFNGKTVKCALLTSAAAPSKDTNQWSDLSANEVAGTGYTAGGATVSNLTVTEDDTGDLAKVDCDDVQWPSSNITARYAVFYVDDANDYIINIYDFVTDKISTGGNFDVAIHADGLFEAKQGA